MRGAKAWCSSPTMFASSSAYRGCGSITGFSKSYVAERRMSTHTYSSYLEIDKLLSSQRLMTDSDDELLFIIIHQAHELWFKLAIHELGCAIDALHRERPSNSDCIIAFKRLSRVSG